MQAGRRRGCPRGCIASSENERAWQRRRTGVLLLACAVLLGREAFLCCQEVLFVAGGDWTSGSTLPRRSAPAACIAAAAAGTEKEQAAAAVDDAATDVAEVSLEGGDKEVLSQVGVKKLSGPMGGEFGGGLVWINRPGQRSFEVRWAKNDTVADIKKVIREQSELPYDNQELRANGEPVEPDEKLMDDWVLEAGGVSGAFRGQAPDIWVFDATDEDEREAAYPPIVLEEELPQEEINLKQQIWVAVGLLTLFTVTQALGVNPFTPKTGKIYDTAGMQFVLPEDMSAAVPAAGAGVAAPAAAPSFTAEATSAAATGA